MERYIFTTKSSSTEYFIPALTRTSKKGSTAYVINGGAAHGLSVGDEFAVYPYMDCPQPNGALVVEEVRSFYSIMRPADTCFPVSGNAVATRVKEGRHQPLRIYSRPGDRVFEILRDNTQNLPLFIIVDALNKCDLDISVEVDQATVRLRNMSNTQCFRIKPTASELARVLKASWKFFSEWYRTADFPDITQGVQVDIYELQNSRSQFPGTLIAELLDWKAVPCDSGSFTLRKGSSYGLKLTNNSCYDLYPTVQFFDPSNELKFGMLLLKSQTTNRNHILSQIPGIGLPAVGPGWMCH